MKKHKDYTNKEDTNIIMKAYENSPNKINELPAEKFLKNIEWRLFTEFCFNTPQKLHPFYKGKTFEEWIDNETHYEMERLGFKWDREDEIFKSNEDLDSSYQKTREKILIALTERAIEFLKSCEEYLWPHRGDKRNLRTSLKPYLNNLSIN